MIDSEPTDEERFPALTEHGQAMLDFLREHPSAPTFRNRSGNRLLKDEIPAIAARCDEVRQASFDWTDKAPPRWLDDFVSNCFADVPYYRKLGTPPRLFTDIDPVSRADFSRDIARFVPDSVALERMIQFSTSGTSGHPLLLPSHPTVAASYLAYHMRALQRFGIQLAAKRGEVGVVLLGMQKRCFTYVSVTPVLDDAGLAKLNLHPNDWNDPADRAHYLNDLQPEVITGDPISLTELLRLEVELKPRAILSTSMTLLPTLRNELQHRFDCPVLDLYSMNEAGPIAVYDETANGHVLLQPGMLVEILDEFGNPAEPGKRGEITLTGGFNFCLPLLRYRTGDFASLDFSHEAPVLRDFDGRPPVQFCSANGEWLNNIEVTHLLHGLALPQWTMHQQRDQSIVFRHSGRRNDDAEVNSRLSNLLGKLPISIEAAPFDDGKVVQYTSDFS